MRHALEKQLARAGQWADAESSERKQCDARVCVGEKNMHKEKGEREQSQERKKKEKTIVDIR